MRDEDEMLKITSTEGKKLQLKIKNGNKLDMIS